LYYVDYGNYQLCPQNTLLKLKLNKSMSSSHSIEYIIYVKQLVFNAVSVYVKDAGPSAMTGKK